MRESKGFPKKKKKLDSISKLKERVWKWFSIYIRLRDADWKGFAQCVTCGKTDYFSKLQAGHFIPGRHPSILFDERGVHPQCYHCNVGLKGNPRKYDAFMKKKYGQKVIDELDRLDTQLKQFTKEELQELLSHFQNKAKKLLKAIGL